MQAKLPREAVTELLARSSATGKPIDPAALLPLVYDDLRALAREYFKHERAGHTLQPTALVHEAFLRLVAPQQVDWAGQTHFFAVCARAMRQVLVDHARGRRRVRRGGGRPVLSLDVSQMQLGETGMDPIELNEALERLTELDPRQARVVELRFFGGMDVESIAKLLGVSKRTIEGDWTHAKAWLRAELARGNSA